MDWVKYGPPNSGIRTATFAEDDRAEIKEGRKFVRPFKEVVGSFLLALSNRGLLSIDRDEINGLFDIYLKGCEHWQVVDPRADLNKPKPKVEVDPETGKKRLEFSEAQARLDDKIRKHAVANNVDYAEAMQVIMADPVNSDLFDAWDGGPSDEELNREPLFDPSTLPAFDPFDPGVNLDHLAREIQRRDGSDYVTAFALACEENPEWARLYAQV